MKPKFKRGDLFKISKEYYYITKYKAERLDCDFKDLPKVSGVGSVLEFDNINEDEEEYKVYVSGIIGYLMDWEMDIVKKC